MVFLILFTGAACAVTGLIVGYAAGRSSKKQNARIPVRRKGVYKQTWTWNKGLNNEKEATVLFLVEEIEQIGEYSRVKLLRAEAEDTTLSGDKMSWCENAIGNLVKTRETKWQELSQVEEEERQEYKPQPRHVTNEQLLQAVLNDNPERL